MWHQRAQQRCELVQKTISGTGGGQKNNKETFKNFLTSGDKRWDFQKVLTFIFSVCWLTEWQSVHAGEGAKCCGWLHGQTFLNGCPIKRYAQETWRPANWQDIPKFTFILGIYFQTNHLIVLTANRTNQENHKCRLYLPKHFRIQHLLQLVYWFSI